MELIRGIQNIKPQHHGCVLTIGNFDGVHLGHQAVLAQVKAHAVALGLPLTAMVFEPQPQELFTPELAPARLMRLRDKYVHLARAGVDRLLCVSFNHHFAAMSAERFIEELLVEKLGVKFLGVGDDFRFGAGRHGDYALLQQAGAKHGFAVVNNHSYCVDALRVSSTAIRQALYQDDLAQAESLLGRPYSISGRVAHGNKLGRTIGFPTANIPLKRRVAPVNGVYAVEVLGIGDTPLPGVANIGTRPTVDGVRQQLEVHLFDINVNLYGRQLEVVLREKIRPEMRFSSFEALTAQIAQDARTARHYFHLPVAS
ncbi:MAG: bifunctional riboflavin kinase/FAD synthetase [Plesiomonas shigelloides]